MNRPSDPGSTHPAVGTPAPRIEATAADGDTWRLSDERGRAVALIFHRHLA